jgi:Ca2+-binding EF-hand superfamily protein
MLLSGNQPFYGPPKEMSWEKRRKIMIDRIMRCEYMKMKGPSWNNISKEARDFVASLLQMVPSKRPSAEKALQMAWITNHQHFMPRGVPAQDIQYAKKLKLKKAAQVLMAEALSEDDIVKFKDALQEQDVRSEDRVRIQHFRDALLQTPLSQSQVAALFTDQDLDLAAHIDYVTMLNETLDRIMRKQEEKIVNSIRETDLDLSCKVTKNRLRAILAEEVSHFLLATVLDEVAFGEEDCVSCQEVLDRLRKQNLEKIDLVCCCREEDDEEDDGDLVDEKNTVIPGGKNDPSERPKYIYDESCKSIRKCNKEEALVSSPCCS